MKKGEVAHFQAKFVIVEGDGVPEVSWKKEGRPVQISKRVHSSVSDNTIHLKLLNSQLSDTGRYTVRLENQNGSTESSAQLIVRGK